MRKHIDGVTTFRRTIKELHRESNPSGAQRKKALGNKRLEGNGFMNPREPDQYSFHEVMT